MGQVNAFLLTPNPQQGTHAPHARPSGLLPEMVLSVLTCHSEQEAGHDLNNTSHCLTISHVPCGSPEFVQTHITLLHRRQYHPHFTDGHAEATRALAEITQLNNKWKNWDSKAGLSESKACVQPTPPGSSLQLRRRLK